MVDRETIEKFIAGDVGAFEQIFKQYGRSMQFIALGLYQDINVAEDAVQECFVYLWNHRKQINSALPIEGYLHTSVKHYVLNYIRHKNILRDKEEEIIREQVASGSEGNDREDLEVKIETIKKTLDTLPEKCRQIFIMSVIEGKSYTDTAEELGVSVNTVKSQVKIAYRKLKNSISEHPDNVNLIFLFLFSLKKLF